MALVTKDKQEKTVMAEDASSDKALPPVRSAGAKAGTPSRPSPTSGGFFTVYKSGQGYWTRMGTAIAGVVIAAWSAYFLYKRLYGAFPAQKDVIFWSALGVFVLLGLVIWWIINKPTNADFLIATDGEMKKVNWTSREELIGSTKVVILFMFLIAAVLFLIDIAFGYFFYLIDVLRTPPF